MQDYEFFCFLLLVCATLINTCVFHSTLTHIIYLDRYLQGISSQTVISNLPQLREKERQIFLIFYGTDFQKMKKKYHTYTQGLNTQRTEG